MRDANIVVGCPNGNAGEIDWIDSKITWDLAAATQRLETIRDKVQPHEPDGRRRYFVHSLRTHPPEASTVALVHLRDGIDAELQRRRRTNDNAR